MRLVFCVVAVLGFFSPTNAQHPTPTPPVIREDVTVNALRIETPVGDTPLSVTVVSRPRIEAAASPVLDDILRQAPGFSIFRRSSSRNANPTTQGVSLRGVGATGASRTGVFLDGVPLNDPFGGWVQWGRVPTVAIEAVEVIRGGASTLYGDASLSGSIELRPRRPDDATISLDISGGSQRTTSGAVYAGKTFGRNEIDVKASRFHTRGYSPIDEDVRGPADTFAGVRNSTISATLRRRFTDQFSAFVQPSYFGEARSNGTALQTNRTHSKTAAGGGEYRSDDSRINIRGRLFGGEQVYDQVFSAVNADRTAESLSRVQRVPVNWFGFSAQASATAGDHTLLFGLERRQVRGSSDEIGFFNNAASSVQAAGGRQVTTGFFAQDLVRIGERIILAAAIRYEKWRDNSAFNTSRSLSTGAATLIEFPDREEDALTPQIAGIFRIRESIGIFANYSRSFRSPTLNELYRSFRVGNVITNSNENLRAERADNYETGVNLSKGPISLRASGFVINVDAPVSNVTLTTTPTLITRQRQNAGATRSSGVEAEAGYARGAFTLNGSYIFVNSEVTEFPANVALIGKRIPQVARHQFSAQASYTRPKWLASIQIRASGEQFDDDLNQFPLEPFAQVDAYISRSLGKTSKIFIAAENVFNSRYSIGRTPVRTVSAPASIRVGFRFDK